MSNDYIGGIRRSDLEEAFGYSFQKGVEHAKRHRGPFDVYVILILMLAVNTGVLLYHWIHPTTYHYRVQVVCETPTHRIVNCPPNAFDNPQPVSENLSTVQNAR